MDRSSDSDEAPEGVSFQNSKEEVLDVLQRIKESVNSDKLSKKKRRQEIEQRNINQKKNKLLAADFLEEIDDVLEEKNNINNLTKKASKKSRAKQDDSLQFPAKEEIEEAGIYVPLKKTKLFSKRANEEASNFKQNMLYRVQTKRIDGSSLQSLKAKRLARRR